jgi:hypothetical protein
MPTAGASRHAGFWSEKLTGRDAARHEKKFKSSGKKRPKSAGPAEEKKPPSPDSPQIDGWIQTPNELLPQKLPKDFQGRSELREKVDALTMENRSLKEKGNAMQKREDLVCAHNLRLERELAKVTRHVSRLLETKDEGNKAAIEEIRRENEKMLVVSRLREQVVNLEKDVKTKDDIISNLQRSQTGTAVLELAVSRDEVWTECSRLKASMKEMEALYQAEVADLRKQISLLTRDNSNTGGVVPPAPVATEDHKLNANTEVTARKLSALRSRVEDLEREKQELTAELRKAASNSDRIAVESRRSGAPTPILSSRRRQKNEDTKDSSGVVNDILKGVGVDMLDSNDVPKKTKRRHRHKSEKTTETDHEMRKENSASKLRAKAQAAQGSDRVKREKARRQREDEAALAMKASREAAAQAGAALAARRVAKRIKEQKQAALDREASKTEVVKVYEAAKQHALKSLSARAKAGGLDPSAFPGSYIVFYRVWLSTNSTPKAAAAQLRDLELDRCIQDKNLSLEDEDDGRGPRFLMRAMVWDDDDSEPGSGFSRTHRSLNRLALTLPYSHFGLVDKVATEFVNVEDKGVEEDDSVFEDVAFEDEVDVRGYGEEEEEERLSEPLLVDPSEDPVTEYKFEVEVKVSSPNGKAAISIQNVETLEPPVVEKEEVPSPPKSPQKDDVVLFEPLNVKEVISPLISDFDQDTENVKPTNSIDEKVSRGIKPSKSPNQEEDHEAEDTMGSFSQLSPKTSKSPKKHGSKKHSAKSPKKKSSEGSNDPKEEVVKSATKIQAVHRGHVTRHKHTGLHKKKKPSIKEDDTHHQSKNSRPSSKTHKKSPIKSPMRKESYASSKFDDEESLDEVEDDEISDDAALKEAEAIQEKAAEERRLQAEAAAAAVAVKQAAAQKAEEARLQAKEVEKKRLKEEEAAKEAERLAAAEEANRQRLEKERLATEETSRIESEKKQRAVQQAEAERVEAEKREQQRAAQQAEAERIEAEKREQQLRLEIERKEAQEKEKALERAETPSKVIADPCEASEVRQRSDFAIKGAVVGDFHQKEPGEQHSPSFKAAPALPIGDDVSDDDYDDEDFADYDDEDFEDEDE